MWPKRLWSQHVAVPVGKTDNHTPTSGIHIASTERRQRNGPTTPSRRRTVRATSFDSRWTRGPMHDGAPWPACRAMLLTLRVLRRHPCALQVRRVHRLPTHSWVTQNFLILVECLFNWVELQLRCLGERMAAVVPSTQCLVGPRPHATARPQRVGDLGHAAGTLLKSYSWKVGRIYI